MEFTEFNFDERILAAIHQKGYTEASQIQREAIPVLLNNQDVLAQSQTGTGKTAAFSLPMLQKTIEADGNMKTLILCPTRELALQVEREIQSFAKLVPSIKTVAVYGGDSFSRQKRDLRQGSNVIIATPGRLLDHLRKKTFDMKEIQYFVLDEADEMLSMGFLEEIESVIKMLPEDSQKTFFSATFDKTIRKLSTNYLKEPKMITVQGKTLTTAQVDEIYYELEYRDKTRLLEQLLLFYADSRILVFCNTKKMVDQLSETLSQKHIAHLRLHGDIEQNQRQYVMRQFREGNVPVLLATDVAARGIDVPNIDYVINYDLPNERDNYVHRIGRTGRAYETGTAISFVKPSEKHALRQIEKMTKGKIVRRNLPSQKQLDEALLEKLASQSQGKVHPKLQNMIVLMEEKGMAYEDIAAVLLNDYLEQNYQKEIIERRRKSSKKNGKDGNYATVEIALGTNDGLYKSLLLNFLHKETGIPQRRFGKIKVNRRSSYIEVPNHETKMVQDKIKKSFDVLKKQASNNKNDKRNHKRA